MAPRSGRQATVKLTPACPLIHGDHPAAREVTEASPQKKWSQPLSCERATLFLLHDGDDPVDASISPRKRKAQSPSSDIDGFCRHHFGDVPVESALSPKKRLSLIFRLSPDSKAEVLPQRNCGDGSPQKKLWHSPSFASPGRSVSPWRKLGQSPSCASPDRSLSPWKRLGQSPSCATGSSPTERSETHFLFSPTKIRLLPASRGALTELDEPAESSTALHGQGGLKSDAFDVEACKMAIMYYRHRNRLLRSGLRSKSGKHSVWRPSHGLNP
jgi:hypothetical protein